MWSTMTQQSVDGMGSVLTMRTQHTARAPCAGTVVALSCLEEEPQGSWVH